MPAPMTTYFAWAGTAIGQNPFVVPQFSLGRMLPIQPPPDLNWLDGPRKHFDHKQSRFQTNFCKGTEMAKIGAKGSSLRSAGGLVVAGSPERSTPELRVVSDPVRASSWITAQLRQAIHEGAYVHGEKLPAERQLAAAFGTSRATVRMALDQLEPERLVTRRVGACTFANYRGVAPADEGAELTSPLELIEVRLALAPYMTRLAVLNATARDIDRMAELMERL